MRFCRRSVITDASDNVTGSTLEQFIVGTWKPLGFFLQNCKTQRNYTVYDCELTAIYESIKYF